MNLDANDLIQKDLYVVNETMLENGMKLFVSPSGQSDLATVIVSVKTGSIYEGNYLGSGISHLLEHLLFKGSHNRPNEGMALEIEQAGGKINAYTSYEETTYYATLPASKVDMAIQVLSEVFLKPDFNQEKLTQEKKVVLREMAMRKDQPQSQLFEILMQTAYQYLPYRYPIIGFQKLFEQISLQDVRKYFKEKYSPMNSSIAVVGNVDLEKIISKCAETFGQIPAFNPSQIQLLREPVVEHPQEKKIESDIKIPMSYFAYPVGSIYESDVYALDVLSFILGGGKSSRLYQNLVAPSIAYSVTASNWTPIHQGLFMISLTHPYGHYDQIKSRILDEMSNLKNSQVSQTELETVRNQLIKNYYFDLQTTEKRAFQIIQNWHVYNQATADFYVENLLKVTAEDIQRVALKYFKSNRLISVSFDKNLKKKMNLKTDLNQIKTDNIALENGLKIILISNDQLPVTSIRLIHPGGLFYESDENSGMYDLLAKYMLKGSGNLTEEFFNKKMELLGIGFNSFSGNDSFGFDFSLLSIHIEECLELISNIIYHPRFDDEVFAPLIQKQMASIEAQDDQPLAFAFNRFKEHLMIDHPYGKNPLGSVENLKSYTKEDVVNFYRNQFDPSQLILSIAGPFELDAIKKMIKEKLFVSSKRSISSVDLAPNKISVLSKPNKIKIYRKQEQDVLLIGFITVSFTHSDRYAIEILSSLQEGQASPLFLNVREKYGAVYFIGASHQFFKNGGYYYFYAGTNADQLSLVEQEIWNEIQRIKSGKIELNDLERAKQKLTTAFDQNFEKISTYTLLYGMYQLYGLSFEDIKNYKQNILNVSLDDLVRVSNQYFNKNESMTFIVSGKKEGS